MRPPPAAFRLASDARLARWAAAGREGAMAAIFERHHQALHRYCHSIVGNSHDAADALQNTMVKALGSLPGETRAIALRPWLYRIAHNESISLMRARRAHSDLDAAREVSDTAAADVVESRARLRSLTADLGELTDRQRGALLMRELSGLEFTEVADALNTSPAAAKQSVYEARCALQAMQEGRAMECDSVRRSVSDGDRRVLRGMRMRGHLRDCAGCAAFEAAMHRRPAVLTAMIPPLPAAVAAGMLHGIAGAGSAGGGFAALIGAGANSATGLALGAKGAAILAVSATVAGATVYAVPTLHRAPSGSSPAHSERVVDSAGQPPRAPTAQSVARAGTASAGTRLAASSSSSRPGLGARPGAGTPVVSGKPTGAKAKTGKVARKAKKHAIRAKKHATKADKHATKAEKQATKADKRAAKGDAKADRPAKRKNHAGTPAPADGTAAARKP